MCMCVCIVCGRQPWSNPTRERERYGNDYNEQPMESDKAPSNYNEYNSTSGGKFEMESETGKSNLNRNMDSTGYSDHYPQASKGRTGNASTLNSSPSRARESNRFQFMDRRSRMTEEEMESQLFDNANEMTQGINFDVYDKIPVELSGNNPPEGLVSFDDSKLHEQLLYNVARCKYSKPTPVQKYAVPCIMTGKDLMACAQTGSGKTAAFLLPIIHRMMTSSPPNKRNDRPFYHRGKATPRAVILSPTRELAIQIEEQARKFLWKTGMRSVVVYGGADAGSQLKNLSRGCELIVATPGRLLDFMETGKVSVEAVQFCVLDEGDRMLDMGFMPQIQDIIREMPRKGSRQTLMFSATFPREIQELAQEFLEDYLFLAVGRVGSTNTFIRQKMVFVEDRDKLKQLMGTLPSCEGLTLIFVETRRDANTVEDELIREGFNAISIHGDRTQKEREHALSMFRSGKCPVLVATDVAARGLDIPNVLWVINYDLPNNIEAYVHRIGRTGRCGHDGTAIAFVNDKNKPVLQDLIHLLRETKQDVPQWFSEMVYQNRKASADKRQQRRSYRPEYSTRDYRRSQQTNRGSTFTSRRYEEGKAYGRGREQGREQSREQGREQSREQSKREENKDWRREYKWEGDEMSSFNNPKPLEDRAERTTEPYSKWNFGIKNDSW
ncbi:hypothetical protein RFI_14635 [Reticulomyxa filosa]|uniref:RNA helicase n=1 Tax=Reticulomyxa filosa TaxID=46433 RepID=X6NB67_RETFI|nr:hypothetical protein RFI_14635 [Reticulomyxa filosa]|eukprot:ETO22562.1 hypothetical protein RFI_14635 [Reticulomyxa filosa]